MGFFSGEGGLQILLFTWIPYWVSEKPNPYQEEIGLIFFPISSIATIFSFVVDPLHILNNEVTYIWPLNMIPPPSYYPSVPITYVVILDLPTVVRLLGQ